jgi:cephalosporin hydroxylase
MLKKIIPKPIKIRLRRVKESFDFQKLEAISCNTDSLGKIKQNKLDEILSSKSYDNDYNRLSKIINSLDLPENTGGINLGDQRAIFYLTKGFSFKSILEIGTHIGCSTLHFSLALNESRHKNKVLDTVDIKDINNEEKKDWEKYGSKYSPRKMIELAQSSHFVNFIQSNSISYLTNCNKRYDLIFLDGSHLSNIVYQEIPLALNLLNNGGIILLHDYYVNNSPIWGDGFISSGPYQAVERFMEEGQSFHVEPIGELPWETKLGSKKTSLAFLSK